MNPLRKRISDDIKITNAVYLNNTYALNMYKYFSINQPKLQPVPGVQTVGKGAPGEE